MPAGQVYISVVVMIVVLLLLAGAGDLLFLIEGEQTISAWLRENPLWFLIPMAVMLVFIGWLSLHLFGRVW